MDAKLTAIMLKATDAGDYDKRVTLFSAEEGKVYATMKGVKKPTAKLKFACQPFALCTYEIAEKAGKKTVTGASQIEDLYALCQDPTVYSASMLCAEITEKANRTPRRWLHTKRPHARPRVRQTAR